MMINVTDQKVKEVLQKMHEAMQRKVKRGSQIKEDIVMENRIFSILCNNFDLGPTKTAILMNDKYGYDMTGDEVIQIFRNRRMANPIERKEILQWADHVARHFGGAIQGKREAYDNFEKIRKETALKSGWRPYVQERIATIMIYERNPEIDVFNNLLQLCQAFHPKSPE